MPEGSLGYALHRIDVSYIFVFSCIACKGKAADAHYPVARQDQWSIFPSTELAEHSYQSYEGVRLQRAHMKYPYLIEECRDTYSVGNGRPLAALMHENYLVGANTMGSVECRIVISGP